MHFQHAREIWRDYPGLVPVVLFADGISPDADPSAAIARYGEAARSRLVAGTESSFPEIQAWRRAFAAMGLKPTQYRCASESLLRRFRTEGALPALYPVVDLCNAISMAFATPIAVLDVAGISGDLEVRHAAGDEEYLSFGGDLEHPGVREVIYADTAHQAHARRWTSRQSGRSAVRDTTSAVLIVAEALHESAPVTMPRLAEALETELAAHWPVRPAATILTKDTPRFTTPPPPLPPGR